MHINHIVMQEDVRNNQYQITHFFLVARQQFIKFLNHTYYISQILPEFEFSKSICFSQNNLINHLSKVFSIRLGEQHYVLRVVKTSLWDSRCQTYVLKPKLHKESKNGFKTITYRPSLLVIFFKLLFQVPKIIEKIGRYHF